MSMSCQMNVHEPRVFMTSLAAITSFLLCSIATRSLATGNVKSALSLLGSFHSSQKYTVSPFLSVNLGIAVPLSLLAEIDELELDVELLLHDDEHDDKLELELWLDDDDDEQDEFELDDELDDELDELQLELLELLELELLELQLDDDGL